MSNIRLEGAKFKIGNKVYIKTGYYKDRTHDERDHDETVDKLMYANKMKRAATGSFSHIENGDGSLMLCDDPFYLLAVFIDKHGRKVRIPLPVIIDRSDYDEPNLQKIIRRRYKNSPSLLEAKSSCWQYITEYILRYNDDEYSRNKVKEELEFLNLK